MSGRERRPSGNLPSFVCCIYGPRFCPQAACGTCRSPVLWRRRQHRRQASRLSANLHLRGLSALASLIPARIWGEMRGVYDQPSSPHQCFGIDLWGLPCRHGGRPRRFRWQLERCHPNAKRRLRCSLSVRRANQERRHLFRGWRLQHEWSCLAERDGAREGVGGQPIGQRVRPAVLQFRRRRMAGSRK
jgi:hypothetical protein